MIWPNLARDRVIQPASDSGRHRLMDRWFIRIEFSYPIFLVDRNAEWIVRDRLDGLFRESLLG